MWEIYEICRYLTYTCFLLTKASSGKSNEARFSFFPFLSFIKGIVDSLFQVYIKVVQLYIYIYIHIYTLFFRFFSITHHYKILNSSLCYIVSPCCLFYSTIVLMHQTLPPSLGAFALVIVIPGMLFPQTFAWLSPLLLSTQGSI